MKYINAPAASRIHESNRILVTHDGESKANIAMNAPMHITMNVNRYFNPRSII